MAYIDTFAVQLASRVYKCKFVVVDNAVFQVGTLNNGNIYTYSTSYNVPLTTMGGSIFDALKNDYPDMLGTGRTLDLNLLLSDGVTPDPNRRLHIVFNSMTQLSKPSNFASWADTSLKLSEGNITIPGDAVGFGWDWGQKITDGITITPQVRPAANLAFNNCRSFANFYQTSSVQLASLRYNTTSGGTSSISSGYYWPLKTQGGIDPFVFCEMTLKSSKGSNVGEMFTVIGAAFPNFGKSVFPGWSQRIDAFSYYDSGYSPSGSSTRLYDFIFINGSSVYGDTGTTLVPPLGVIPEYVSGGGGGSGGGTSTGGGGTGGNIGDSGTGQTDTGNLEGVDPEISGSGLVTVNPDGTYDDTFGGGIAQIGSGVAGGYMVMAMSLAQTSVLFNRMFSNSFLDSIKDYIYNFFQSVKDAIIAANIFPFALQTGVTRNIYIGGQDTGAVGTPVSSQFVNISLGSVKIPKYWDNFLDWARTSIQLMVPFVGWVPLETTDVMGRTISLRYNVDVITGQFAAILHVSDGDKLSADMYQWTGTMAMSIPITSNSVFDPSMISSLFALGGSLVGGGVPAIAAQTVSATAVKNFEGDQLAEGSSRSITYRQPSQPNPLISLGSALSQPAGSRSGGGGATGAAGLLAPLVPAVRIDRPIQALPDSYGDLIGYPSNIYKTIGDLTGYTEVQSWSPEFTGFTTSEITELDSLLRGGVYL